MSSASFLCLGWNKGTPIWRYRQKAILLCEDAHRMGASIFDVSFRITNEAAVQAFLDSLEEQFAVAATRVFKPNACHDDTTEITRKVFW